MSSPFGNLIREIHRGSLWEVLGIHVVGGSVVYAEITW